jgi:hypothetical protein
MMTTMMRAVTGAEGATTKSTNADTADGAADGFSFPVMVAGEAAVVAADGLAEAAEVTSVDSVGEILAEEVPGGTGSILLIISF